ncbi:YaaC family protein [Kalamiella sp. sgz302252]|uniref:YaaC family protein n=1 Tax=Pantoea sp. sgz302252 TaxID=3341827 RepID=UPI0036D2723D
MAFKEIMHFGEPLTIHKARITPDFNSKKVLVSDSWDYVNLWLKRNGASKACFFWGQAENFYKASKLLDKTASPLTAYYCFLNATKALLISKGVQFGEAHGVSGFTLKGKTSLSNEKVKISTGGVMGALCKYLGDPQGVYIFSLKDLLYNLPYIHRAYSLSYKSSAELFIRIENPRIVKSITTSEAWFVADIDKRHASQTTINKLPNDLQEEKSVNSGASIRLKQRFKWKAHQKKASLLRYQTYHKKIRKHIHSISGPKRLWYVKRDKAVNISVIDHSSLSIAFAAMHKLSELARYTPDILSRHFDTQQNWLISEFIENSLIQYIDEIASEITSQEFILPGRTIE